jgi:hypothetical protein
MTMRAHTDPRKIYARAGQLLVCFEGAYFGTPAEKTHIDPDKEVKCAELPRAGTKARVKVTQGKTTETWPEQRLKVQHRTN